MLDGRDACKGQSKTPAVSGRWTTALCLSPALSATAVLALACLASNASPQRPQDVGGGQNQAKTKKGGRGKKK